MINWTLVPEEFAFFYSSKVTSENRCEHPLSQRIIIQDL